MYTVFGDESHDQDRSRVFAVAGVFGSADDWDVVGRRWSARAGGRVFHAADCDSDRGDFAKSSHHENKGLYRDLTKILASSNIMGFGAAAAIPEYNLVFGDSLDYKPYFFCFCEVITRFAAVAHTCIPRGQVTYTFERNNLVEYDAGSVYEYALKLKEWPFHEDLHPGKLSFGSRDDPRIQMADLLARETMKHLDNQLGPVKRPTRGAYRTLQLARRFKWHFFQGPYFRELQERTEKLSRSRDGAQRKRYDAWRAENGLPDSVSSRIKHQAFLDQVDRAAGLTPMLVSGPDSAAR